MKYLTLILSALFSSATLANEWSPSFEIREVVAGYKGGFVIVLSKSSIHNPNNCTDGAYVVHPNSANVDHALSVLLSAEAREKPISVAVSTSNCATDVNNYPLVTRLKIVN